MHRHHTAAAVRLAVGLILATTLVASSLAAQGPLGGPPRPDLRRGDRVSLGLTLAVEIPRGDFDEYAGVGVGLSAHILVTNQAGWLGLRVSGEGAIYQSVGTPVVGVGQLSVGNRMGMLGVGPQFTVPTGPVRPYGYAAVGGVFVRTDSSISGLPNLLGEDPVYTDVTHMFELGGGLYLPLTSGARSVALDLGARYRWNGDTRFLGGRGVALNQGQLTLTPIRQSPRLLVLSLGAAVGL